MRSNGYGSGRAMLTSSPLRLDACAINFGMIGVEEETRSRGGSAYIVQVGWAEVGQVIVR